MTPNTKYYQVTAKCGHVGRNSYVPINFAVKAESASDASQIAKRFPRVKKQLWDCVIACVEVTKKEYKDLLKANRNNPYLSCKCNRQQKEIEDFDLLICKNEPQTKRRKIEPVKSMKYKRFVHNLGGKRNNLCLCCLWED